MYINKNHLNLTVANCQFLNHINNFMLQAIDGKVLYVYKKVAMVEQFFDIIYSVHVEAAGENQLRGRAGKHCGQKRTYRAVRCRLMTYKIVLRFYSKFR